MVIPLLLTLKDSGHCHWYKKMVTIAIGTQVYNHYN